jgi:predicted PurR-regulated permease PerM
MVRTRLGDVTDATAERTSAKRDDRDDRFSAAALAEINRAKCGQIAGARWASGETNLLWPPKRAAVAALVVLVLVVAVLAVWKLRGAVALAFLAITLASAMRPTVDRLAARGVPRPATVMLHFGAFLGLIALFLSLVVPTAIDQVDRARASASSSDVRTAKRSGGIEQTILLAVKRRLAHLPEPSSLVDAARSVTKTALDALAGIFFTFAVATYWIFERDRAICFVTSLLPPAKRRVARETWLLIDLRLGAYVRGVLLMVLLVSTVLSLCFWLLGVPYWLLLGPFAGVVELLPVIGPLIAGAAAVGAALTVSWQLALETAAVFYGLRLVQDYLVNPRVLGGIVELSPLVVLVAVAAVGVLIGPAAVPLATPFAAVLATLLDVTVRDRDPEKEDPPTVILGASEPR